MQNNFKTNLNHGDWIEYLVMIDLSANQYAQSVTVPSNSIWDITNNVALNYPNTFIFDNEMKFYICTHMTTGVQLHCYVESLSIWFSVLNDNLNQFHYLFGLSRKFKFCPFFSVIKIAIVLGAYIFDEESGGIMRDSVGSIGDAISAIGDSNNKSPIRMISVH